MQRKQLRLSVRGGGRGSANKKKAPSSPGNPYGTETPEQKKRKGQ
jgi:hypothetical protein